MSNQQDIPNTLREAVEHGIDTFENSRSFIGRQPLRKDDRRALTSHIEGSVQRALAKHIESLAEGIVPEGDSNELEFAYNVILTLLLRYADDNEAVLPDYEIDRARQFVLQIERERDQEERDVLGISAVHQNAAGGDIPSTLEGMRNALRESELE